MVTRFCLLLHLLLHQATSFLSPSRRLLLRRPLHASAFPPENPELVTVLPDAEAVSAEIVRIVNEAAAEAIAARGSFALAIPGGSVLNMLMGVSKPKWAKDTVLGYVNHKCVDMADEKLATHAKACKLFLDDWAGVNVITLGGSDDSPAEAAAYEKAMRDDKNIPVDSASGLPVL